MSAPKSTILAVDDAEDVRRLVQAALGKLHVVKAAPDARTALRLALEAPRPDLVLLDADLAGASGYEVCKAMKATPALAELPVIFLSEVAKPSDIAQGFRYGAIDCLTKPLAPAAVLSRVETHLEHIARERSIRLEQSREQLVGRLTRALELHSGWPSGNRAVRLAHYARVLAQAAGARDVACDLIMKAAPLFDIGKLGVPAELLRKEALLQGAERAQFERHPTIGAEIIGESDDPLFKLARTVALSSRERWDGSGYPGHLKGNDIPWGGRVMAIVAAFEALTSPPYHRAPLPLERAAAEVAAEAGKQFDPALVQALQKALPALRTVYETYADKQLADADDEVIGGPAPKRQESEADRTLIAPLALRGTPVSDEARARMAGERAAAEDKAAQAARERRDLEQAAALAAEQRALAEEKLAAAAEKRIGAEARAAGADPQTQIALNRAQEMLAQLQKERGTLQAELQRLQTALAEKEKERAAAPAAAPKPPALSLELDDLVIGAPAAADTPKEQASAELERLRAALGKLQAEHDALQAELQRAKAALGDKAKEPPPAPSLSLVLDDDVVIGSPSAQKSPAPTAAVPDQALQKEHATALAERDKALAEVERLQAALVEADKHRAAAATERDRALAECQRLEAGLADAQKDLAAQKTVVAAPATDLERTQAERDHALGELKRVEAALAAAQRERTAAQETTLEPAAADVAEKAALAEAEEKRAAAEALRDEAIAELTRLETVLAEAQEQRERSEAAAALATTELARAKEALVLVKAREEPAKLAPAAEAAKATLAQAEKERAAAEEMLARVEEERRRLEELARVQQELTRENEASGRRIADEMAQVRAERERNEELLAQLKAGERAAEQSLAAARDREAAEARAEEAARRRRQEDEAATRAAEERRLAEEALIASVAERERNEERLAQPKADERAAEQSFAAARDREAAEARAEEAARRRRQEDEAATRAAEERRLAEEALIARVAEREAAEAAAAERSLVAVPEAPAQSLARPAPRARGVAMGFVLGVLAAAATGAVLWFSGVLELVPLTGGPAATAVAAPPAEVSALAGGAPLQLRPDDTLPAAPGGR